MEHFQEHSIDHLKNNIVRPDYLMWLGLIALQFLLFIFYVGVLSQPVNPMIEVIAYLFFLSSFFLFNYAILSSDGSSLPGHLPYYKKEIRTLSYLFFALSLVQLFFNVFLLDTILRLLPYTIITLYPFIQFRRTIKKSKFSFWPVLLEKA